MFQAQSQSTPSMTGNNFNIQWIVDTGASNHTTGNLSMLNDVREIQSHIGLPNGAQATTMKADTVILAPNLTLYNVLYVPNFTCNLISVSQLLCENKYTVQFTDILCVIQDQISRMLIGAGEQRGGLYYLPWLSQSFCI